MVEYLSERLLGRLAALLFILSGSVTLLTIPLPGAGEWNRTLLIWVALVAMGAGVVTWRLPWHRWSRAATLWLVPLAFALISAGNVAKQDPWTFGVFFLVVFMWIGIAHRPGTSLRMLPAAIAAYFVPFFVVDYPDGGPQSFFVIVAACLLAGESLAWLSSRLRRAEGLDIERMGDMDLLVKATAQLAHQTEATAIADLVAGLGARLLRGDAAAVLLAEPEGALRGTGSHAWPGDVSELSACRPDEPAARAMATGDITVHTGPAVGDLTKAAGGRVAVFVPLVGSGGSLGVLMLVYSGDRVPELDSFRTSVATTFGTQAGLAFERLHATQALMTASLTDPLTGIGNRRVADRRLQLVEPGDAVAILDLDHFKDVNDRWGHGVGDVVLSQLATFLEGALRDGDTVARYGGEEFVIVVRGGGFDGCSAIIRLAERWRATSPITTFSAGVAVHRAGSSPAATLNRADEALYEAKKAGRNRIIVAPDIDLNDAETPADLTSVERDGGADYGAPVRPS